MKKTITTIIIVLLASLSASAQIFSSGGIGAYGTRTSYGRSGGGGMGSGSGESKIYTGSLLIFKSDIDYAGDGGGNSLNYAWKLFAGATVGEMLITGNYEWNIGLASDNNIDGDGSASLNTRVYGEVIYPLLGSLHNRFALSLFAGAGVNMLDAGSKYDFDLDQYIDSDSETAFYAPMGVYIDLNVKSWNGLRFGYTFSVNTSDYSENTFSTEGITFGSFIRF